MSDPDKSAAKQAALANAVTDKGAYEAATSKSLVLSKRDPRTGAVQKFEVPWDRGQAQLPDFAAAGYDGTIPFFGSDGKVQFNSLKKMYELDPNGLRNVQLAYGDRVKGSLDASLDADLRAKIGERNGAGTAAAKAIHRAFGIPSENPYVDQVIAEQHPLATLGGLAGVGVAGTAIGMVAAPGVAAAAVTVPRTAGQILPFLGANAALEVLPGAAFTMHDARLMNKPFTGEAFATEVAVGATIGAALPVVGKTLVRGVKALRGKKPIPATEAGKIAQELGEGGLSPEDFRRMAEMTAEHGPEVTAQRLRQHQETIAKLVDEAGIPIEDGMRIQRVYDKYVPQRAAMKKAAQQEATPLASTLRKIEEASSGATSSMDNSVMKRYFAKAAPKMDGEAFANGLNAAFKEMPAELRRAVKATRGVKQVLKTANEIVGAAKRGDVDVLARLQTGTKQTFELYQDAVKRGAYDEANFLKAAHEQMRAMKHSPEVVGEAGAKMAHYDATLSTWIADGTDSVFTKLSPDFGPSQIEKIMTSTAGEVKEARLVEALQQRRKLLDAMDAFGDAEVSSYVRSQRALVDEAERGLARFTGVPGKEGPGTVLRILDRNKEEIAAMKQLIDAREGLKHRAVRAVGYVVGSTLGPMGTALGFLGGEVAGSLLFRGKDAFKRAGAASHNAVTGVGTRISTGIGHVKQALSGMPVDPYRTVVPRTGMAAYYAYKSESDKRAAFGRYAEAFAPLGADPSILMEQVEPVTQFMSEFDADAADAYAMSVVNVGMHLADSIPEPPMTPFGTLDREDIPSSKIDEYLSTVHILENPTDLLNEVAACTIENHMVEAVQRCYPELYNEMRHMLFQAMGETPNPPYQVQLAISRFMGFPLDSMHMPPGLSALQSNAAQTPSQARAIGLSKVRLKSEEARHITGRLEDF